MSISITSKCLNGIKNVFQLIFSYVDTDPLTQTLEQKLGWLGDTNQTHL